MVLPVFTFIIRGISSLLSLTYFVQIMFMKFTYVLSFNSSILIFTNVLVRISQRNRMRTCVCVCARVPPAPFMQPFQLPTVVPLPSQQVPQLAVVLYLVGSGSLVVLARLVGIVFILITGHGK